MLRLLAASPRASIHSTSDDLSSETDGANSVPRSNPHADFEGGRITQ